MFFDVTSTELEYDDNLVISLEGVTGQDETFFSIAETKRESTYRDYFNFLTIIVQQNKDLQAI